MPKVWIVDDVGMRETEYTSREQLPRLSITVGNCGTSCRTDNKVEKWTIGRKLMIVKETDDIRETDNRGEIDDDCRRCRQ